MRRYPYAPAKFHGYVEAVGERDLTVRIWRAGTGERYPEEFQASVGRERWPAGAWLGEGALFSIPARRDRTMLHPIRRGPISRRQAKATHRWIREVSAMFEADRG